MKVDPLKDWLPVGTVIAARFIDKKLMIIGYGPIDSKTKRVYDYSAVVYPDGFATRDNIVMINRDFISRVYYFGYSTKKYKDFSKTIDDAIKEYNERNNKNE